MKKCSIGLYLISTLFRLGTVLYASLLFDGIKARAASTVSGAGRQTKGARPMSRSSYYFALGLLISLALGAIILGMYLPD